MVGVPMDPIETPPATATLDTSVWPATSTVRQRIAALDSALRTPCVILVVNASANRQAKGRSPVRSATGAPPASGVHRATYAVSATAKVDAIAALEHASASETLFKVSGTEASATCASLGTSVLIASSRTFSYPPTQIDHPPPPSLSM